MKIYLLVLVAALGYFVDIYDLILFSVVRVPSLKDLGLADQQLLDTGVLLLNLQMAGMLIGGILFGIMGDKKGRVSVLFGSILLYSLANFANAYVHDVTSYAILRFIAGLGLAGELGAGITLVSETLPKKHRGLGTTVVASVGVSGALLAWTVASEYHWRTAFTVGGVMGLLLLCLRIGVFESGLFQQLQKKEMVRGSLKVLFGSRSTIRRLMGSILLGAPLWYVVGILMTLSPEFSRALGVQGPIEGGKSIFYCYAGLIVGDLASGLLSQFLQSRRKAIALFHLGVCAGLAIFFGGRNFSVDQFYGLCFFLGCAAGYWAMFVTVAAEQFGTDLRATVATSVPNFVRGSLILLSAGFMALKEPLGILPAGLTIGVIVMALAFWGVYMVNETYHQDLNFEESKGA